MLVEIEQEMEFLERGNGSVSHKMDNFIIHWVLPFTNLRMRLDSIDSIGIKVTAA
jgi:hypothetical protein